MPFNPDKINIHELTIEEPEKEAGLPFDVERDITEEDWKGMRENLENNRWRYSTSDSNSFYTLWSQVCEKAIDLKILDPKAEIMNEEPLLEKTHEALENAQKNSGRRMNISEYTLLFKMLDPKKDIPNDYPEAWQIMEGQLRKYKKDKNWGVLAGLAMKMKIMNPEFSLDEDSERALADTLDDYKKYKDDDVNWHVFASLAAEMKIIDPDIDLQLDDVFWRNIKEQLEKERKKGQEEGYWDMFARHAGTAKILAAGKVKFTENGLEFMPPEKKEDLESTIPAMPETKQF